MGQFISAGHNPAYLFRASTGKIERLFSDAFFLGMFEEATYRIPALPPRQGGHSGGDFRRGYRRAKPESRKCSESRDFCKSFGKRRRREVAAIEQELLRAIEEFTEGMAQTDDITFVVVEKYQ